MCVCVCAHVWMTGVSHQMIAVFTSKITTEKS